MRVAGRDAGALVVTLAVLPALAQAPPASAFLGRLAREWHGAGEVSGMAADTRMLLTRH